MGVVSTGNSQGAAANVQSASRGARETVVTPETTGMIRRIWEPDATPNPFGPRKGLRAS
jgi:hypothetical protein